MKNYCKILTASIALILSLELDALAVTLPFAKGEHPRILITSADIPALAAKVDESTDPLYLRYMTMKQDVDSAISKNWNWSWIGGSTSGGARITVVSAAFVYLIENYLHPDSASFYVNGVKQVLENTNPNDYTGYARELQSFAVAYDWIYNGLSPQDRITIGNKLMASYAIQQDPTANTYGFGSLDNWHWMFSNMPSGEWTYAAIAIWKETDLNGNADNSLAQTKLNQIRTFLTTKKIPFTNMVGGGINPDGAYDDIGGSRQFALELYAWDKATGENLWNTSRYLQDNLITRLFAWRMYAKMWVPFGMFMGWSASNDEAFCTDYPVEILSKKDPTGIAQYVANDMFSKGNEMIRNHVYRGAATPFEEYRWVIFYGPQKPATNYNTLPLARYEQGYNADGSSPIEGLDAGWVFFRSGWTNDDTIIAFTSGDWFTSKQVCNVNAFSIYRRGDLAVMNSQNEFTGKAPSSSSNNYAFQLNYGKPTVSVNSITVSDPSIAMDQGQELLHYKSVLDPNDPKPYCDASRPPSAFPAINSTLADHFKGSVYDRGDITKFETKNNYAYAVGDGSKAYHPDRLTNFQRALAFLDKKYLVIFDRVTAAKPNFVKRWYLHTVKEPTIPGTPLIDTSSQDGSTTWSGANFNNLYIDSDPSGGRLFVKSLLPEGATYRKRGGEGFFFWRNDRSWNPEPGSGADQSNSVFEGRKGWRLEQDVSGQKDDIFLNVLFPTDATVTSMPETVRISQADGNMPTANMVGAHIKDSAENKVVLFSPDSQGAIVNGSITYSVNLTANGKHFLFDLDPGLLSPALKYDITAVSAGSTQTITISPGSGNLSPGIIVLERTDKGTLVFTTTFTPPPTGQGSITGKVTDTTTGMAISGASITVTPGPYYAITDGSGIYTISSIPSGNYTPNVSAIGYNPATINNIAVNSVATVDVALLPITTTTTLPPTTTSTTTTTTVPTTTTTVPTTTTTVPTTTLPPTTTSTTTTTTSSTTTTTKPTTTTTTTTSTTITIPKHNHGKDGLSSGMQLIVAQASDGGMTKALNYEGGLTQRALLADYPFGDTFTGGIHLAKGDIDGDGAFEIIMAQAYKGGEVKAYNHNGELIFDVKPFGDSYAGGINLACGDIDGDGISEILVAQASLPGAIKAYKYDGTLSGQEALSVNPLGGITGTNIATGNYDGDKGTEIIVAQAKGGGAIKVYKYLGNASLYQFVATQPFGRSFKGGINVATGDINGDGNHEILLSQASNGGNIKVYKYSKSRRVYLVLEYRPFGSRFYDGVNIAAGRFTPYDTNDVIAVAQASNGGTVRAYTYNGIYGLSTVFSNAPFGSSYTNGINLTLGDIDGDSADEELVLAQAYSGGGIKGYKYNGTFQGLNIFTMTPFGDFTGGINVTTCD